MKLPRTITNHWAETGLPPIAEDWPRQIKGDNIFSLVHALAQRKTDWVGRGATTNTPVTFLFLDSSSFGAWAVRLRNRYVVALSAGTLICLMDFYGRLTATWTPTRIGWRFNGTVGNAKPYEGDPLTSWQRGAFIPDDPATRIRAMLLARRTAGFIIDHELAHILHGHCDVDEGQGLQCRIDAGVKSMPPNSALFNQACELQADRFAACMMIDPILGVPDTSAAFSTIRRKSRGNAAALAYLDLTQKSMEGIAGSRRMEVFGALLCQFTMFRLFDDHHWTAASLQSSSHPPGPMRYAFAVSTMKETMRSLGDQSTLAMVRKADREIRKSGERMFASAIGRAPNLAALERARSKEAADHYRLLAARSASLRQVLSPRY